VIVTSALHLSLLTREDRIDFKHALGKGAGSATAFCLSIMVIWPVGALLMYHVRVSDAKKYFRSENVDQRGLAPLSQCDYDRTGMAVLLALSFPITPLCASLDI